MIILGLDDITASENNLSHIGSVRQFTFGLFVDFALAKSNIYLKQKTCPFIVSPKDISHEKRTLLCVVV